jgi:small subunit ribosomal protein S4
LDLTVSEAKENCGKHKLRLQIRNQARELLALTVEARQVQETKLLNYLNKLGLVKESATVDDVLNLKLEDILERRLQTIIMKKGISKSPQQSRQLVVHGHVSIGERIINIPGYMVKKDEEPAIVLHDEFITRLQNPQTS